MPEAAKPVKSGEDAISQHKRMAMGESIEGAPTFGCVQSYGSPRPAMQKPPGIGTQGDMERGKDTGEYSSPES